MKDIFPYIKSQCHSQQFDVNALLDELQISDTYLREISRKHFGLSPSELIESVRLDTILSSIENHEHFVIMSQRCGFGSIKTFNRAFSKRVGISAAQARRQLINSEDKEALREQWREKIWSLGGRGIPSSSQKVNI